MTQALSLSKSFGISLQSFRVNLVGEMHQISVNLSKGFWAVHLRSQAALSSKGQSQPRGYTGPDDTRSKGTGTISACETVTDICSMTSDPA